MKKSEIAVTLPLTAFEEYEQIKKNFEKLKCRLCQLFDTTLFDVDNQSSVIFDTTEAVELCKEFLPYRARNADIRVVS